MAGGERVVAGNPGAGWDRRRIIVADLPVLDEPGPVYPHSVQPLLAEQRYPWAGENQKQSPKCSGPTYGRPGYVTGLSRVDPAGAAPSPSEEIGLPDGREKFLAHARRRGTIILLGISAHEAT